MSSREAGIAAAALWLQEQGYEHLAKQMMIEVPRPRTDPVDLTGKRLGRLTVVSLVGSAPRRWRVRCDCGVEKVLNAATLLTGSSKSCGCWRQERMRTYGTSHGASKAGTQTYKAWTSMRHRCGTVGTIYEHVKICDRWDSFEAFRDDMGECPSTAHSIDRFPNQAGDYNPDNCRWATRTEQGRNRRSNRLLTIDGVTLTVTEWAERSGVKACTVFRRIYSGWSVREAVFGKAAA